MPSAKYSWPGSPERFCRGSTAIEPIGAWVSRPKKRAASRCWPSVSIEMATSTDAHSAVTSQSLYPTAGDYKLVCLFHQNHTAIIHVLDLSAELPHDQAFYSAEAADM